MIPSLSGQVDASERIKPTKWAEFSLGRPETEQEAQASRE
jgi:hypothetical protein